MTWWRRLMRWIYGYHLEACPWCKGQLLVRDESAVHVGNACSGWKIACSRP